MLKTGNNEKNKILLALSKNSLKSLGGWESRQWQAQQKHLPTSQVT